MSEKESGYATFGHICLFLLYMTVIAPLVTLLNTVAYRLIWGWYLAPEFGPGPSTRAWFGIGTFVGFALLSISLDLSDKPNEKKETVAQRIAGRVIFATMVIWLMTLVVFLWSRIAGWS